MEEDLLRWFRNTLPAHRRVLLGAGDDAAVLKLAAGAHLVATTDMVMEGVDFRLGEHETSLIGRKSLAINLSDLAAMAAQPVAALVSLALPSRGGEALAKELYAGLLPLAAEFDCPIAGGDVNSWAGPLVVNITALGEVEPGREWRRSGARLGDLILVTGSFGGSILGKHLSFTPRVNEARWLAQHLDVRAAIDVSDGLSLDLSRLAGASGVGAAIHLDQVPVSAAAQELSISLADGTSPLDHALADGEDFELILAASPQATEQFFREYPDWRGRLTNIGKFIERPGLWAAAGDTLMPLPPRGYQHRLDA